MRGIEYIRQICKEKGVSVRKLEADLGFANGYLNPKRISKLPYARAVKIAEYLDVDVDRILDLPADSHIVLDSETAQIARDIYENDDLKVIFSTLRSASKEDLQLVIDISNRLFKK